MLRIAIVGNIACGKSTVENLLTENGYLVFDTDKISHEILYEQQQDIINKFQDFDIIDEGKISRKKLGSLVFKNKKLRKKLEEIIYPKLKERLMEIFKNFSREDFVFISIPLLFEVGWQKLFDKILFIDTSDKIRLKRLMERNNLTEEEALARINAQQPTKDKIKNSDFVICNNGEISDLQKEVNKFIILLRTIGV